MDLDLELVYVGDPMCSWCWGFAPVVERLDAVTPLPLRIVAGGLRPGPLAEPIERIRGHLEHHWAQVAAKTGQPFDHRILGRPDWVYDTMPADTAVVTMRTLAPDETLRFFTTLQRAFYAEGVDITDDEQYRTLVAGFPVDEEQFMTLVRSEEMRAATEADFAEARQMGVTGFPTLLVRDGSSVFPLSLGYAPFELVSSRLDGYLERRHPTVAAGLVCELDGDAC